MRVVTGSTGGGVAAGWTGAARTTGTAVEALEGVAAATDDAGDAALGCGRSRFTRWMVRRITFVRTSTGGRFTGAAAGSTPGLGVEVKAIAATPPRAATIAAAATLRRFG